MHKIQYREVRKFFVTEGLAPNEIHSKFIKFYVNSSPSFSTIRKWAAGFKRGRISLEGNPYEGRPKNATTPEIIKQVHDMLLDDRRINLRGISETIDISKGRVGYIFHEKLVIKRLCAKWCRACLQQIKNALA